MNESDTIAAISTPVGEGGIGIVRISGKDAFSIGKNIFVPHRKPAPDYPRSHYLYYGHILSECNEAFDEVLVTFMKAPRTYTREDTVEIDCHSGILTLRMILKRVLKAGARMAGPGEFTRRAFLNGRIDLSQAESVLKIIRARSDEAVKIAVSNLKGRLSKETGEIRDRILDVLARIEAHMDFPEDLDEEVEMDRETREELIRIKELLGKMADGVERGRALQEGLTTAIIGKPNAGKSSLLNALLKEQRAIVHEVPGTTRDLLEGFLTVGGYPLRLIDTAGIHGAVDPVEREGIARAKGAVAEARLLIVVLDASTSWSKDDEDVASLIRPGQLVVVVINKMDLDQRINVPEVAARLQGYPVVQTSATLNRGIDQLEDVIVNLLDRNLGTVAAESPAIMTLRHAGIVQEACDLIEMALRASEYQPLELVSLDLKEAWMKLGEINGATVSEELLDRIFSEFCIGK